VLIKANRIKLTDLYPSVRDALESYAETRARVCVYRAVASAQFALIALLCDMQLSPSDEAASQHREQYIRDMFAKSDKAGRLAVPVPCARTVLCMCLPRLLSGTCPAQPGR